MGTLHQGGAPLAHHPNSHDHQPESPLPAAQQHHRVATAATRSASLPFNIQMGLAQSRQSPPPSSSAVAASATTPKGLSSTVSNGLKRTFARRRKNSEDASKVFAGRADAKLRAGVSSPSLATTPPMLSAAQRSTPPRIETKPHPATPNSHSNIIRSQLQQPPAPMLPKKDTPLPVHHEPPAAGSRSSVMTNITDISSAVNFITLMDEQQQQQAGDAAAEKGSSDKPETTKESWRKSDSTNSHHTIRPPGTGTPARGASRPVSWADSLQSTHTLMPQSNKRRSALIGDADFGMAEEEPEDEDEGAGASVSSHSHATPNVNVNVSPTASTRSLHRRSMSLNVGASPQLQPQPIPTISHSVSEGVPPFSGALGAPRVVVLAGTPSAPKPQQPASNLRGRLAAWSAAAGNPYITAPSPSPPPPTPPPHLAAAAAHDRNLAVPAHSHPAPSSSPSSFRQTAISIGVGSAAAGIARRTVDKIGRKWAQGMGISASSSGSGGGTSGGASSGAGGWSSSSSASTTDPALHAHMGDVLVRTSSNLSNATQGTSSFFASSHGRSGQGQGHKRTPGASGGTGSASVSSASMASGSDSDFFAPSGPVLGVRLRGALRRTGGRSMVGGVVFGRNLGVAVRETGVRVGVGKGQGEKREGAKTGLAQVFEERALPAIVVRCAQHLVLWGVQEEGLFRVPGRSAHVSKLRAEFDSGADWDMEACEPGDLDPHAVASVFKAYLRELPEPILTQRLQPLFDDAMTKEASKNAGDASSTNATTTSSTSTTATTARLGARGVQGLPSGPKSGFTAGLRKPPSLSTLAMPSFTGIPPPSPALVSAIKALVSQLPVENRDLLLTVVDLIRETAKRSKETKMPLSNLLVVFCPSLGMTPPLLKTLCEVGGIWGKGPEPAGRVIDIRRREVEMVDTEEVESEDARSSSRLGDADSVASASSRPSLDNPSEDYHGSAEGSIVRGAVPRVLRADFAREVPTVYLDSRSHMSATSSVPSLLQQDSGSIASSSDVGGLSGGCSIGGDGYLAHGVQLGGRPPLSSSSESVVTPTSSGNPSFTDLQLLKDQQQPEVLLGVGVGVHAHAHAPHIFESTPLGLQPPPGKRTAYAHAGKPAPLLTPVPVPFPVDPHASPLTPSSTAAKRRSSVPMLSLPVMTPFSPAHPPSAQHSPVPSQPSPHVSEPRTLRGKKPSLKLLFSKRSASSLNSAARGLGVISAPVHLALAGHGQGSPRSGTGSGSNSSSSVSTPLSAVTAPTGTGSAGASAAQLLPPVLDTPIEGAEFEFGAEGLGLGIEMGALRTAVPREVRGADASLGAGASPRGGGSPYGVREREEYQTTKPLPPSGGARRTIKPGESHIRPQASSSNLSLASSHHLSLFEDDESDEGIMEGWTQSVLLAADVDGQWVVQTTAGGGKA